ncbi:Zn-ribbon domain-containing OB-fold protein [Tomitella gaofuii]|uniref:Zn-ribbon domain-containing OB-fold protein n=1 Tax=Tomitella gaofuii TaxID=2760083 RepID=UPI0015FC44C7|nr:OB-fold nucleic acid binding domain-containing protein [Tomitella gaofuii]
MPTPDLEPLSAPIELQFDYTRSVGPVIGRFLGALARRRIVGVRGSDGRVHVPPVEFDPDTADPLDEFVEVGHAGQVVTWSWVADPVDGNPLSEPFAFALIRLDGADTAMVHAVKVDGPARMSTGMRVRAVWAETTTAAIGDIVHFVPEDDADAAAGTDPEPLAGAALTAFLDQDPLQILVTPFEMTVQHSASVEESSYLRAIAEGRVVGQRCPETGKVYVPPRGASPTHGVPTNEEVEVSDTGTVTTFCIVNVPFIGQKIKPPYVGAYILLDGADIPLLHLVLGCDPSEVRMGMRVRAVWKPREEWVPSTGNIEHFAPTGEPDAPYESYAEHL